MEVISYKKYRKKLVVVEAYQTPVEASVGMMVARPGDYIVIGKHGRKYILPANLFEDVFEPANEDE